MNLLSKAVDLERSAHTLAWKYTYDPVSNLKQSNARVQMGQMAAPIVESVRDLFMKSGIKWYLLSLGYTLAEAEEILDGKRKGSVSNAGA